MSLASTAPRLLCGLALAASAPAIAQPVLDDGPLNDYWVYVCAESADEVYLVRFDGTQAVVERRVEVGVLPTEIEGPHGLTMDPSGDAWYLSMAHGVPFGTLYKFATEDDRYLGSVELGLFPATMQISRDTGLLYCVNFDLHGDMSPSSVSIVDPEEMVEVARVETGAMPHGSRLSRDGTRHYSCAMMSDELVELDAVRFEVERRLVLSDGTGGLPRKRGDGHHDAVTKPTWVQPHPSKDLAYVCLNGAAQVVEVDLAKWRIRRRFPCARGPYNVDVSHDGARFVTTYKSSASVGIWDIEAAEELARVETSRRVPHGVVITPDGRYALVSCEGIGGESGTVDVFHLESLELVATCEVGLQAGGITLWKSAPRAAR